MIGELAGAHGVRGEARLRLFNADSTTPAGVSDVFLLAGTPRRLAVRSARRHGRGWLVRLEGLDAPEPVRELTGIAIAVRETDLEPATGSEYYHYQLVGLEVRDEAGALRGRVREVISVPGSDLLAIDADGREHLVPFVEAFVKQVDVPGRRIVIHAAPGLFGED